MLNRKWNPLVVAPALVLALAISGCGSETKSTSKSSDNSAAADPSKSAPKGTADSDAEPTANDGAPVPSAGCEAEPPGDDLLNDKRTMTSSGEDRQYLLTIPAAASSEGPVPVVLDLHGLLEGDVVHATMSKFSELGLEEGFAVITPNGSGVPLGWKASKPYSENTDMIFLNAAMDEVEANYCIDTSRRYATGLSNGAIMTSALACGQPNDFAAVAPVAGIGTLKECDSTTPIPVLAIHGTADPILTFNGGVGDLNALLGAAAPGSEPGSPAALPEPDLNGEGYPSNVAEWAARNGCKPEATDTPLPEVDGDTATSTIRRVYDCPDGADTEFYIVIGAGHSWPGSEFSKSIGAIVGPTTFDFVAAEIQWDFFKQFHR